MKIGFAKLFLILLILSNVLPVGAIAYQQQLEVHTIKITDTHDGDATAELFLELRINGKPKARYPTTGHVNLKVGDPWDVGWVETFEKQSSEIYTLYVIDWDLSKDDSLGSITLQNVNVSNTEVITSSPGSAIVTYSLNTIEIPEVKQGSINGPNFLIACLGLIVTLRKLHYFKKSIKL